MKNESNKTQKVHAPSPARIGAHQKTARKDSKPESARTANDTHQKTARKSNGAALSTPKTAYPMHGAMYDKNGAALSTMHDVHQNGTFAEDAPSKGGAATNAPFTNGAPKNGITSANAAAKIPAQEPFDLRGATHDGGAHDCIDSIAATDTVDTIGTRASIESIDSTDKTDAISASVDFSKKKITVLYADTAVAVVYKPHGLLTVGYEGSKTRTALDELEAIMRKNGTYSRQCKPLLVHRLDRETSGVLLFALTEGAQKTLVENWHSMVKSRMYRAVCENPHEHGGGQHFGRGSLLKDSGTIDVPLSFNAYNQGFVKKDATANGDSVEAGRAAERHGKTVRAVTHYRFVARGNDYSLLELELDTGKKNQIRAHLAYCGYPLAGDAQYRAKTDPFGRVALHARTLTFEHPYTHKVLCFEVPEPQNWLKTVTRAKTQRVHAVDTPKKESLKSFEEKAQKYVQTKGQRKESHKQDFIARGKSAARHKR